MQPLRIGMIAGEASGDTLGAELIRAIQAKNSDVKFEGIGGPKMQALGFQTYFPMETLSVMGVSAVLARLPLLLRVRKFIKQHFIQNPPHLFIGIDSPDFNLGLENAFRKMGIPTLHYVSPTVWAWRQGRIKKITSACSHMLTLFPFEADFYQKHNVPVSFVGHPLADLIPMKSDKKTAKQVLELADNKKIIAILPGSRLSEVRHLNTLFLQTAELCLAKRTDLQIVIPCVNQTIFTEIENVWREKFDADQFKCILGRSHDVLQACDVVLLASGTATLEAMLYKKPMVVAYRLSKVNYFIGKLLVKTPFIAIPNLLAGKKIVPEFIQEEATPPVLMQALLTYLQPCVSHFSLQDKFNELHTILQRNGSEIAADVALGLIQS